MTTGRTALIAVAILVYADVVVERILHDYDAMTTSCALLNALSPFRVSCSNSTAAAAATVAPSFIAALRALPPIPRVVHVAWKSDRLPPSSLFSELTVRRLASTNPRWSVRLYNDSAIERYLRASLPAAAYAAVAPRPIVEKVDLWRLVVMHREGGVYADADRWALQPLDGALGPEARLVLPTFRDGGPSQDFMASAPGSPLFAHAIRLNVARRAAGWRSIYALGPTTYAQAVAHVVLGAPDAPADPARHGGAALRAAIEAAPGALVTTAREAPPCTTATARVRGLLCVALWAAYRRSKEAAYEAAGVAHWTRPRRKPKARSRLEN